MTSQRPNPDELLAAVQKDESPKGALRIYLGYAPGVGKSYAMLKNAQELKAQGVDVVVGYLEAHGRVETESLLEGLEVLPAKVITVGGSTFRELDLDAALARKPQVILVDELAHTNMEGCRHPKRWQDIEELCQAGVAVHTTLNVQHLGSLGDIVAQITGVQVRETIPDSVFDNASEVTLVDLTPDELLKRLKTGKVYKAAQAERAMGHYFRKTNLVALREIALRRTAERVHADVTHARVSANIQTVLPTQERVGCIVDTDVANFAAIRAATRLARALQCPLSVLQVSSARQITRLPGAQDNLERQVQLAEELGGKIAYRSGAFWVPEVLHWARQEGITKLFVARPSRWHIEKWIGRLMLIWLGRGLDVVWISPGSSEEKRPPPPPAARWRLRPYAETTGIVLIGFGIAALLGHLDAPEANLAIVYLLAVIVAAVIHGQGASAYAAVLSSFILSFGLTNFTWRASWTNAQYLVSFGLTLAIGLLASQMTSRLRQQAQLARQEQQKAEALYNFTVALSSTTGLHQIIATAQNFLQKYFGRPVILLLPTGPAENHRPLLQGSSDFEKDPANFAVADWVAAHHQPAGPGTHTLPHAKALYLPLKGAEATVGVMAIVGTDTELDQHLYEKFTHPLATRLESAQISEKAESIYWQAERERLRGDLLSSVSQGLKMPLTVLAMTSADLVAKGKTSEPLTPQQHEMLGLIRDESIRLQRLVDNLTQLTRVELGHLTLHPQKVDLNDWISDEVFKLERLTGAHPVSFHLAEHLPQVTIDPLLFGQVVFNIIDNAVQHTPRLTPISVITQASDSRVRLIIEDAGEGIPEGQLEKIFEKYYRVSSRTHGAGLGLTVCRAIVEAHGARLWAENRTPRGLRIVIEFLPPSSTSHR